MLLALFIIGCFSLLASLGAVCVAMALFVAADRDR